MSTRTSLILLVVLLVSAIADAATIEVPNQAATILEAVELAASGDVILLTTDIVDLGGPIAIQDKNLTITGRSNVDLTRIDCPYLGYVSSYYKKDATPTLTLERANVTIRNVSIPEPCIYRHDHVTVLNDAASPIVVCSGTLRMFDCSIHCSIEASGNIEFERTNLIGFSSRWNTNPPRPPYPFGSYDLPALRVRNAAGIEINIRESSISGDYDEALTLENMLDSKIHISNSILNGGIPARIDSTIALPGYAAIAIRSCTDFLLDTNTSVIRGGNGGWSHRTLDGIYAPLGVGGHALVIDGSTGTLLGGDFKGGVGAWGKDLLTTSIPPAPGSPGGTGIQLIRSIVEYFNIVARGGDGGTPSLPDRNDGGPDGLPIVLDGYSTFTEITGIDDWIDY